MQSARYDRQMRLAEVGEEGQRRISQSRLSVGSSQAAEIEAMYLERAGVLEIARSNGPEPDFEHRGVFKHGAPRTFGAGAWQALRKIALVLDA